MSSDTPTLAELRARYDEGTARIEAILAATGIMLAIAFRSVLVPIKAIIMNTLSVSATFGLIVLVFQRGIGSQLFGLDGPTSAAFGVRGDNQLLYVANGATAAATWSPSDGGAAITPAPAP